MTEPSKHKIYIVGGKGKNVPPWISAAFECEQFHQDCAKTRTLDPSAQPDAVVVMSSWVGHEHFYGARDLAEKLKIPLIISPGGWSTALKSAADLGVEWFITDIEKSKNSDELSEQDVEALETFTDNAWRQAYNREWTAREALERRYGKMRVELEEATESLTLLKRRDEAGQRVIAEIRAAAAAQRKITEEVEARNDRIATSLSQHLLGLLELIEKEIVDSDQLTLLRKVARIDLTNMAEEDTTKVRATPVSASNTEAAS